jgi:hypothetical protein
MKHKPDGPFIVKDHRALIALRYWLKKQTLVNTFSYSSTKCINLGHDTRPDSDWGGRYTPLKRIIILDETLFDEVEKVCKRIICTPEARPLEKKGV